MDIKRFGSLVKLFIWKIRELSLLGSQCATNRFGAPEFYFMENVSTTTQVSTFNDATL